MKAVISGAGWVTPLGNGLDEVSRRVEAGEPAAAAEVAPSQGGRCAFYYPVPAGQADAVGRRMPRIRRSSPITYYSVTAGLAALEEAGEPLLPTGLEPGRAARTAVIFAVCSGGVQYTRRFYEKVAAEGPAAASPILFPETVHNAPASHLAAALGVTGASYTLVGDGSTGLSALRFAAELLATEEGIDQCVVAGAEECDWILWEGYAAWRLLSHEPCVRLHAAPPRGMILAEGAAAVVVRREGGVSFEAASAPYFRQREAGLALEEALAAIPAQGAERLIGSANGTWVDAVEAAVLARRLPEAKALYPKAALGEMLGAGALFQVALAAHGIARHGAGKTAVTAVGLNQQAAAGVLWR